MSRRLEDIVDAILYVGKQAYRTAIAGRDLVFVPYFTVDTERYNTYFRIA